MTKLFSSWETIAIEERIVSAIDHSHIAEFERNVLLIEADHPGWIQILQMKQQKLLDNFQRRFPNMRVNGISFRLSRSPISRIEEPKERIDVDGFYQELSTGKEWLTDFSRFNPFSSELSIPIWHFLH
jgi:hypothetical protein